MSSNPRGPDLDLAVGRFILGSPISPQSLLYNVFCIYIYDLEL